LLSKTAPIQAFSLLVVGPLVDYLLSGKFIMKYNMSSGCFVSISLHGSASIVMLSLANVLQFAAIHSSLMWSSCVLQHKPVPLHRAVFSSIVPSYWSHENRLYPHAWMAPI